jgi:hypothetical protein
LTRHLARNDAGKVAWSDGREWGLTARRHSDADAEGAALEGLKAVGMQRVRGMDPIIFAKRSEIELDPSATSGCVASFDPALAVARFNLRGSLSTIYRNLLHEFGHYLFDAVGVRDHDEGDATRAGLALWVPRHALLVAIREVGLNPAALAARFPYVPMQLLLLRVAWVIDRAVVLHLGRQRLVWAPEGIVVPEEGSWEHEREIIARKQGEYVDLLGADAWRVADGDRTGTLLILPPRDDADAWRRIDGQAKVQRSL